MQLDFALRLCKTQKSCLFAGMEKQVSPELHVPPGQQEPLGPPQLVGVGSPGACIGDGKIIATGCDLRRGTWTHMYFLI